MWENLIIEIQKIKKENIVLFSAIFWRNWAANITTTIIAQLKSD